MSHRDVVWITIESLRFDHTSLGGHIRNTTPTLASLASESGSTSFDYGHSHGIWTPTSSGSILTGRAPTNHRVGMDRSVLPDSIRTLPERFHQAGYRTICCSPNAQLSSATGLDRGFESLHYISKDTLRDEVSLTTLLKYGFNVRRHGGGFTTDTRRHNTGYFLNELARSEMKTDDDRPLFLYVHHGDSHQPYTPPPAFRKTFASDLPSGIAPNEALELALDMNANLLERMSVGNGYTDEELAAIRVMYDTQLLYVDSLVDSLIEDARDHLNDPIIVVTADHGELLGEYGLLAHRFLCDTKLTHVPMIIAGVEDTKTEGELAQHADLMAIVTEDVGVDTSVDLGIDLRETRREIAFTQRGGERVESTLSEMDERELDLAVDGLPAGTVTSAVTTEYRYVTADRDDSSLYEIPQERTDVSNQYPDVADELDAAITDWLDRHGAPVKDSGSQSDLSDGMKDQLRQLGYLVD